MNTAKTPSLLHAIRDALSSLVGYPPVMEGLLTRRLEDRTASSSSMSLVTSSSAA